jgi:hypothetical protein
MPDSADSRNVVRYVTQPGFLRLPYRGRTTPVYRSIFWV